MSDDPSKNNPKDIEGKVRAARREPRLGPTFHLGALHIEPDGSVILDGEVPSVAAKKIALEKADSIPGIIGIVDRLHVNDIEVVP